MGSDLNGLFVGRRGGEEDRREEKKKREDMVVALALWLVVGGWQSVVIAFLWDAPGNGRAISSCGKSDKSPLDLSNKYLPTKVLRSPKHTRYISCASPASSTIGVFCSGSKVGELCNRMFFTRVMYVVQGRYAAWEGCGVGTRRFCCWGRNECKREGMFLPW